MTDSTMTEIPGRMSAELREALERAKGYKMSPEEIFEQKVSFVYGQQDYDNPNPKSKDEIRQMLIESQGRPACEKCAEAAAMLKASVEALELGKRLAAQVRNDLASAHAEICKLQGLDPAMHTWPDWSPQANTLRWLTSEVEPTFDNALASVKQPGGR